MSFSTILAQHRSSSFSSADKGLRFERLMGDYLQTDPRYAVLFESVWLWSEFPYKDALGGHDVGIDLVARTTENEYWAIQCKCYHEDARIEKSSVDSFLATSGRSFVVDGCDTRFSHRLWISTTNHWSKNAEAVLENQLIPVSRLNLSDLESAPVDWDKLDKGIFGVVARSSPKELRPHQKEAVECAHAHFSTSDRGKLIMACGTGKTFTALKIAEKETGGTGLVLVLVPSIALISQTLCEWTAESEHPLNPICICSDASVSKKRDGSDEDSGFRTIDLALPASTDVERILAHFKHTIPSSCLTVVFATYQSINVVSAVQKRLGSVFDLIICDEAHRTTGAKLAKDDDSYFTKVHDNTFIEGKKRLYMTATPRIYSESSKKKAEVRDIVLSSMDDENLYGREFYRLGFGQAVEKQLLADYRVLVLTVSEDMISSDVQRMVWNPDHPLTSDDAAKLVGCINAFSKRFLGDEKCAQIQKMDPNPMKKAVAFCRNIKMSKEITESFNTLSKLYQPGLSTEQSESDPMVDVSSKHIDGSMRATERDCLLTWLKAGGEEECRVLTNARCLSEGVDVPSLDAVMFLSAKNSQIDVVQSVGRVMRKAEGKQYGYIIIPVFVSRNTTPEKELNSSRTFDVIWTVLNALRAHDDRTDAVINRIVVGRVKPLIPGGEGSDNDKDVIGVGESIPLPSPDDFDQLQSAIYAQIVLKVGTRKYMEQWGQEVKEISERYQENIARLVREPETKEIFKKFLTGLQDILNPGITPDAAIEMLSQHMITRPIFDAVFQNSTFTGQNPVSVAMQQMIEVLIAHGFEKDTESFKEFYNSIEGRVARDGRQKVIVELYDKFFKIAFPRMAERLGIVYTPIEVVNFILHSVDDVLQKEFGRGLTEEDVHILDPFTGTGTFISQLIESDIIRPEDLVRKYQNELHANEIVLLAYYIAAVNIEDIYHNRRKELSQYESFPGICFTDTFQRSKCDESGQTPLEFFIKNSERVDEQKKTPITVIIGNPPYSAGQRSANDNAQNMSYPEIEKKIAETYVHDSAVTNKVALYDSYIKAFRWASDRLDENNGGIICFVSNGGWIDGNAMDGFRRHLEKEFSRIYVLNLRGNTRTSGELGRREGGQIFGSGSRATVAITLLVKKPQGDQQSQKAVIFYHDIGDELSREKKLTRLKELGSIDNPKIVWDTIHPNPEGDWINKRNATFTAYIPIGNKKIKGSEIAYFVSRYSNGVKTHRDDWVYNSSRFVLQQSMRDSIAYYNKQIEEFHTTKTQKSDLKVDEFITYNSTKFVWSLMQIKNFKRSKRYHFDNSSSFRTALYRPFFKQYLYFNREMNDAIYLIPQLFPTPDAENQVICVSGIGSPKPFSALITNCIPDHCVKGASDPVQCFPLYYYEEQASCKKSRKTADATQTPLFTANDTSSKTSYVKKDGISNLILEKARKQYQKQDISKEDIFYYIYGILHSQDYQKTFSADLKKMLPHIPLIEHVSDFKAFSKAGRNLADLHLYYETVPLYSDVTVSGTEVGDFLVTKMRFQKKGKTDTIIYNSSITITGIPKKAYQYMVNGTSAIEWIMERYQVKTGKNSQIKNDPNDWAKENDNPRYILDLLLRIINVSVQTVEIVEMLPDISV